MINQSQTQICAVCGYALSRAEPGSLVSLTYFRGAEWGHIADSADHVAVPADPGSIIANHRCDFCSREEVTDVILADSFDLNGLGSTSIGSWSACQPCADLAERGRWSQLATRVRSSPAARSAADAPRSILLSAYQRLALHVRGRITLAEWQARGGHEAQ